MTDEDTRSLPAAAQAALRNRAVRAVLDGMTQAQAARVFGVHHNAVYRWIKRYRQGGWDGLAEQRRGRRPGEQAALTEPQQQEVIALVRREGGVVLWLDEMGVRADAAAGRSWAPVGQTPVIKRTGKRFRVNMISAISNQGLLRFRLFTGSFTGPVFIDFLRRLLRDCPGRKVHLIVDGHPVHRAKLVSGWLERHPKRIELHFLPGYSPELNPVELLNHDVKANAAGRRRARSAGELADELRAYARHRQRHPAVVIRFFQHPDTCYASTQIGHTIC